MAQRPADPADPADPVEYALAPQIRARLMGLALVLVGVLVCVVTVLVSLLRLPLDVMSVLVIVMLLAVVGLGYVLNRRSWLLRVDPAGYQVRLVRGAGVRQARWSDVADMATTEVEGARCLVLRLRDGGATTIPVDALVGDADDLVRALRERLDGQQVRSRGRRP